MNRRSNGKARGFSVLEVVLAASLFVIFATGSVIVIVQSYNANRLGEEQTIATQFATEGIEAAFSVKNQAYTNLTTVNATPRGVQRNGTTNVWEFLSDGTNNQFGPNNKYTRQVKVEAVSRDAAPPLGNIVASGGTLDPDTKKVTASVSWTVGPGRTNSVDLVRYFTDWRKAIANIGDALVIYGDTSLIAQPRYRTYTDATNVFSSPAAAGTGFTDTIVGKTFKVKTSPTQQQALAGYVNNSGQLRILCFDGTAWTDEWSPVATVGGTGTNDQRFALAFEKTSGDALVVYSRNVATTNELAYRTKTAGNCGTGWSAEQLLNPQRTSGIVHWIRLEASPVAGSNTIYAAWADAASHLSAFGWNGTSWSIAEPAAALEINLERVSASQDVQSFDLAVESVTGNAMVVWGLSQATTCTAGTVIATTNCIRYSRYTTAWSAVAAIATVADPATNIDITANPNTNELVLAAIDNSQGDLSTAYWSGSAWTGRANVDTASHCVAAGEKIVATGWLINGAQTRSIIIYHDATSTTCTTATTNIGWRVANGNAASVAQTDFAPTPAFGSPQRWYDIQMDPFDKNKLLFMVSDTNADVFAKRLVMNASGTFTSPDGWSNADGSAALTTTLGQATTGPFSFAYWRN